MSAIEKNFMLQDILSNKISNRFLIHCLKIDGDGLRKLIKFQRFYKKRISKKILQKILQAKKQFRRESKLIELKRVLRKSECIN